MLAGMTIATSLGLGITRKPMLTAFSMNLNGNAITVSNDLYDRLVKIDSAIATDPKRTAVALKQAIEEDKTSGKAPLNFAMVYPFSNHNYEIRYWMASAGINPDNDVHLRVIPPQYMVDNLKDGLIDGFCVGGPWNSAAVEENVGQILITGYDVWNNSPEKVFGVTSEWAEKYPDTHLLLIKALLESAAWIDNAENRNEVAEILADESYIGISKEIINNSIASNYHYTTNGKSISVPDFNVYHRYLANFPWCSHASWIITQMYRWGQLSESIDINKTVEAIYRPDIYRQAAEELGLRYPSINYKTEGEHHERWVLEDKQKQFDMGADVFLDEKLFQPDKVLAYITEFEVNNMKIDIDELKKLNKS
jgi:two-component system, oxyanion-binding sensor